MKDPFCKCETVDSQMTRFIAQLQCGYFDGRGFEQDALLHYEPETIKWMNPDGTTVVHNIPANVRGTPRGTRIEIANRYRGRYIGEGVMIVDTKYIISADPATLFERVWVRCNPHRVRIELPWKVSRIS